ncbi:4-coumarate--CoA ligase 1 isoform X2 [Diachasma alloeum]|uniref:4-coumarate--CoA ligase 1 isoform X2 n=1 Tax=Diachasma alloeum TaxID=454923 RepID=UPI0007382BB7|nr:4-coumarate--CoA ligase 1 isoform X2 [Diachasma alloeum]
MILKPRMCFALFYHRKLLNNRPVRALRCLYSKNFGESRQQWDNKSFGTASHLRSAGKSVLHRPTIDENNVFRSRYEDVEIPSDYIHQHVWKDAHKWWNEIALLTLMNPAFTAYELSRQLENSDATAVITNTANYATVMEAIKMGNISIQSPVIVATHERDVPSGAVDFRDLVSDDVEEFEKTQERMTIDAKNDTVILPYSSGTTGLPKGVELTHRHLVANLNQMKHPECAILEPTINGFQDIVPAFLPLYHIYGLTVCLLGSLSYGAKIICMSKFTSDTLLSVLEKYRATIFLGVPPVIQLMINDDRFNEKHLARLKILGSGAAPLTHELITKFRAKMGSSFRFSQGYGLTETSPMITLGKNASTESVGLLIPNTQVRIVHQEDDPGRNLGVGEIGEILVRGPQVMKGYYKNVKATEECMDKEWFRTGDLGYIDEIGQLFITGRIKELIKVQGSQVSPAELENILYGHENIADAAVVGVPHPRFGEVPKAFVVIKAGAKLTEDEIKDFVAKRVVKYKRLAHVVFTDKIIKSAAGKILRKELQKL